MSYQTRNEWNHFDFEESHISEMRQISGYFYAILDNVTILPENSCNRDIRKMRTNQLTFTVSDGQIVSLLEEGYNVYDADGVLLTQHEDHTVAPAEYSSTLKELTDCTVYSLQKDDTGYVLSIDTEDHTYLITVTGSGDTEKWERFFSPL